VNLEGFGSFGGNGDRVVREELRWLVIYSTEPRRKIAIPNNVAGFETIRAELVSRHLVFVRAKVSSRSFALPAISILSWAAMLLFRDVTVVIAAGVIALISLAVASHHLWILLHRGPRRLLI
jgi:hypothetical protein